MPEFEPTRDNMIRLSQRVDDLEAQVWNLHRKQIEEIEANIATIVESQTKLNKKVRNNTNTIDIGYWAAAGFLLMSMLLFVVMVLSVRIHLSWFSYAVDAELLIKILSLPIVTAGITGGIGWMKNHRKGG